MLRYDACYPITPESVDSMERPTEVREVTLASRVGPPTDGRWESFGWKIVKLKTILSSR
jgi:hypothetical protein